MDAFKASVAPGANAIRAHVSQKGGDHGIPSAICLYPEGAEQIATKNFCLGKELDGSIAPGSSGVEKREFSIFGSFCGLIDIPFFC